MSDLPVCSYETLTLEQLEACMRGDAAIAAPPGDRWSTAVRLHPAKVELFALAKRRGWLEHPGTNERGQPYHISGRVYGNLDRAWQLYCRIVGRPFVALDTREGYSLAILTARPREGHDISRAGVLAIDRHFRPEIGKGSSLSVACYGVRARMRDRETARAMMAPLTDLIFEHEEREAGPDAREVYAIDGGQAPRKYGL